MRTKTLFPVAASLLLLAGCAWEAPEGNLPGAGTLSTSEIELLNGEAAEPVALDEFEAPAQARAKAHTHAQDRAAWRNEGRSERVVGPGPETQVEDLPGAGDTDAAAMIVAPGQLEIVDDCEVLLTDLKEQIRKENLAQVYRNMNQALQTVRNDWCYMYEDCDGGFGWDVDDDGDGVMDYADSAVPGATNAGEGQSAKDYSGTNNQVVGVDEADFIKNDGSTIYMLAGSALHIIDAWPAPLTHEIARVEIDGTPKKLFVHGDRALIYSSLGRLGSANWAGGGYYGGGGGECTYGYDCELTGDGRATKLTVLDISDLANPQLVREIWFGGSLLAARRIGERVHTVATSPRLSGPALEAWPENMHGTWDLCDWRTGEPAWTEEEVFDAFSELNERNKRRIQDITLADFLPSVKDVRYVGGAALVREDLLTSCQDVFRDPEQNDNGLITLLSLDIDRLDPLSAVNVVSRPGAVYASRDALYMAVRRYGRNGLPWYFEEDAPIKEATTVHKFRLGSGGEVAEAYLGSGVVKGRVLNQFSMDEHNGFLRIATTTGRVPNPQVHSTMSILGEFDGRLELTGQVDDIAPTEDIRSVRFRGDTGYIVTFKKTDPLFVFDLTDAYAPAILGELKIPGYSTYMHPMDRDHLLAIGYEATEMGNFAYFQGIQLQVFDVSDLEHPALLHKTVIGTRGSTSEATTNHLAFNYYGHRDLLAIPMVICEGGERGRYGYDMTFSGLLVYHLTVDEGFSRLGGIPHADPVTGTSYRSVCGNWWTRSNSHVKRSIFMEEYVYSVAQDMIQVAHLSDLEHPVASVVMD